MATAAPARTIASPAIRALMSRRLAELGGLALGLSGAALLVALANYNPNDPSFDTATSTATTNIAGPVGAIAADLLLQGFGVAAAIPGLVALAWAWRIASHRGFGRLSTRVACMLLALPVWAGLGAAVPGAIAWPASAGFGGAVGRAIAGTVNSYASAALGPLGTGLAVLIALAIGLLLAWQTLGFSAGEWRAAGTSIARHHRTSRTLGRNAAGLLTSWMARRQALSAERPTSPIRRPDFRPAPPRPAPPRAAAPRAAAPEAAPAGAMPDMTPRESIPAPISPSGSPSLPAAIKARISLPARKPQPPRQESLPLPEAEGEWRTPPLSLLKAPPPRAATGPSTDALQANARLLESVLDEYGVQGTIRDIRPGPVVTLYELEPAPGIRSARVIGLADDVARSLSVTAVRIATVSGRNVIGIEVPNAKRETVFLSELLGAEAYEKHPARLALALGKDIGGDPVLADLARMPHLLVAGTTGSGKSVGINAMILSLLYRLSPDQCRLILIDPKMLELSVYDGIPHLMAPVVTEPAKAVTALKWTVREMERRYRAMSQLGVRNVAGYNDRVEEATARGELITRRVQTGFDADTGKPIFEEHPLALEKLPFLVVVIDEMADLMMVAGKEIEAAVQRLAQMARAAGIHVIMATQRPSVDVITGTIKANFPTRISFTVISKFDSRTILGEQGAEQLLGQGDMLYMQGGGRIGRVHGPFVTDREVEDVVAYLRDQGEPTYLDEVTEARDDGDDAPAMSGIAGAADGDKSLFDQAVAVVAREGKASTSFIQRHLSIGYNRAAKLIEQMEREGIITPANHVGKREILVRRTNEDD